MTRGIRRALGRTAAAVVGASSLLLSVGAASAGPPTITDDLDDGRQGWEL